MIKVGDIVTRKSYGGDIYFRVVDIDWHGIVELVGLNYRIKADAPSEDLMHVDNFTLFRDRKASLKEMDDKIEQIKKHKEQINKKKNEEIEIMNKKVKVLHVDGDEEYLKLCMKYYKELGIEIYGEQIPESEQSKVIVQLLKKYKPDILVITGHDAISKDNKDYSELSNYRSSKYFVETVLKAREYEPDMDQLIIFAGACQSHYEALMQAGANFASSPERVLIHALDPVLISEKIASTPVDRILKVDEALKDTFTGVKGLGGYETRGKARKGLPKGKYKMTRR